jgi:8-oxo-dGTP diphosphatase
VRRLVVGAVIVDSLTAPSCVWATRRSTPADLAGRWEFPGGKVEPDESPHDALRRELREELAVEIEIGDEVAHPSGAWPINDALELRLFAVRALSEPVVGDSHDAVRRLAAGQLDDVTWLPSDAAAIPAVRRLLTRPR